jgi:hypothetical protein
MITKNDIGFWQILGTLLLFGMSLGGLVAIQRLAKSMQFLNNKIIVNWIFRNKKIVYDFSELVGFNWDTLRGPADYKQIKLFFRDKKTIGFSDFEYCNFYKLESFVQSEFQIFCSYSKMPTDEQIKAAYEESRRLDREQIITIKLIIIVYWILIAFIMRSVFKDIRNDIDFPVGKIAFLSILFTLFIWTILKFIKQIIRNKELSSAQQRV